MTRNEIKQWLDDPQTAHRVKAALLTANAGQPLPAGIIAGGAVANTLANLLWGIKAPITDIDVYSHKSFSGKKTKNSSYVTNIWKKSSGGAIEYALWDIILNSPNIWVGDHAREGMINKIVLHSRAFSTMHKGRGTTAGKLDATFTPDDLIKTFDLNCTQAALTTDKELKLHYSEDFLTFLEQRAIQVTSIRSPCATAARYFAKKDQLNALGDDAAEMRILSQLQHWSEPRGTSATESELKFGYLPWSPETHAAKIEKYEEELSKYFDLSPRADKPKWYRLTPKDRTILPIVQRLISYGPRAAQIGIQACRLSKEDYQTINQTLEVVDAGSLHSPPSTSSAPTNFPLDLSIAVLAIKSPKLIPLISNIASDPIRTAAMNICLVKGQGSLQERLTTALQTRGIEDIPADKLEEFIRTLHNTGDLFEAPKESILPIYTKIVEILGPRAIGKTAEAALLRGWLKNFAEAKIRCGTKTAAGQKFR